MILRKKKGLFRIKLFSYLRLRVGRVFIKNVFIEWTNVLIYNIHH